MKVDELLERGVLSTEDLDDYYLRMLERLYKPPQQPTQEEIQNQYDEAPVCRFCGIKEGFAPGTGDCGCDSSDYFDVG